MLDRHASGRPGEGHREERERGLTVLTLCRNSAFEEHAYCILLAGGINLIYWAWHAALSGAVLTNKPR
jgi:hypothetical protein